MKKFIGIVVAITIMVGFNACKKGLDVNHEIPTVVISLPTLEKNIAAPNGVLHFKNKESVTQFMEKIRYGAAPEQGSLPSGFKNIRSKFDDFRAKHPNDNTLSKEINSFEEEQFFYDLDKYIVQDEEVEYVLNEELQLMIADKFYQMTRIGLIIVDTPKLKQYKQLYDLNEEDLYYNKNFTSFTNEVAVSATSKYQTLEIETGIYRLQELNHCSTPQEGTFFNTSKVMTCDGGGEIGNDDGSGGSGSGGGGSSDPNYGGVYPEGTELLPAPEAMDTYTAGTDFDKEVHRRVGDRRFKFQAYNHNYFLGAYTTCGIKGKLQRLREILWGAISWWGESFADEIIIGVENMDLRTGYVFPYPHQYNTLPRPSYIGIGKQMLGNYSFDVVHVDVNLSASFLGYSYNLTTKSLNTLISGQLNDFKNNQFDNLFAQAVNDIATSFDPGFKQRYKDYAMQVQTIDDQHRLKFQSGYVRRPQGYSHINRWEFDANAGIKYTSNNGGQSGSLSGTAYGYEMKHGSFFGKARLGGYWWKFRIVIQ